MDPLIPSSHSHHLLIRILGVEVVEALSLDNVSNGQAVSVERLIQGSRSISVLNVRIVNSRVDKRHDATQSLSGGQRSVAAEGGHILGRRVEVLLGLNKSLGGVNDGIVITELVDNVIGKRQLGRRSISRCLASSSEVLDSFLHGRRTLSQALAPPRRTPGDWPARVAA